MDTSLTFHTSSFSVQNCVAVAAEPVTFTKSSFSWGVGECVEVGAASGGRVFVRDDKYRGDPAHQPTLDFTGEMWQQALLRVQVGEFELDKLPTAVDDLPTLTHEPRIARPADNIVHMWCGGHPAVKLQFTDGEWMSFLKGAKAGEFELEVMMARSAAAA